MREQEQKAFDRNAKYVRTHAVQKIQARFRGASTRARERRAMKAARELAKARVREKRFNAKLKDLEVMNKLSSMNAGKFLTARARLTW